MASGTFSTASLTSTSTGDPLMTSLFIADTPCSEIRLSSCESSNSCILQVLPSALCWDDAYSTWAVGTALSCIVTSTPLTVPVVTSSQSFCPMGMTTAKGPIQSDGAWCCPLGFTWASASLCQSSLTPGGFPQISDACARGNTVAFAPDTTQLFKRMTYSGSGSLNDISSPVPSTHSIRPRLSAESGVTAVFAEAVYLAAQAVPASTVIVTKYYTSGVSPSPSGSGGNSQGPLSGIAKIAIGLGGGILGALLVLLGAILIRRHRKRQLREAAKDEMIVIPSYKGYNKVDPESGNRNKARFDPTRTHCELEAASPTDIDDEIICLYCPELQRSTERENDGERTESEVSSGLGATLIPTNRSEPVELEAKPLSSGNQAVSRQNTKASSQVLPWQSERDDYWALDSYSPRHSEESEHRSGL